MVFQSVRVSALPTNTQGKIMSCSLEALNFQKQIKCEELIQHKTKVKTNERSFTPSGCLFLGTNVLWKKVPMRKIIINQAILQAILDG